MKTTFCLQIFLSITISFRIASNTIIQLPLTINPLLQNWVRKGYFSTLFFNYDSSYYSQVSFSDIINKMELIPRIEGNKSIEALVILATAAKEHGLKPQDLGFLQPSKWSINMSEKDFANVSVQFTIPVNDTTTLFDIQEKMFKVLENKFEFTTDEVAQKLNKSKAEIYSALEPGWIDTVHFIAEKNILRLAKNYTIPPFYIAQALNMSQAELYNSTLPQLEDILKNKLHIIKEAAERLKLYTSTAGFTTVASSTFLMLNTSSTTNSTMSTTIINKTTPLTEQTSYIQMIVSNGTMAKTPSLSVLLTTLDSTPLISSILNSTTNMSITQIIAKTAFPQSSTFTENPGISLSSELTMSNTIVSSFLNNTWSASMHVSLTKKQSTLASTLQVKPLPTDNHTTLSMQATTYPLDYLSTVSGLFSSSDVIKTPATTPSTSFPANVNGNASMFTRTTSKSMQRSSSYVNENTTIQISISKEIQVPAKSSSQISDSNSTSQISELAATQLKTTTNFLKASFVVANSSSFAITTTSALWKSSTATLWSSKTLLKNKLTSTKTNLLNTVSNAVFMGSSSKHEPGIVSSRNKQATQLSTAATYTVVTEPLKPTSVVTETWKSTSVLTEPWKSTSVSEPLKPTSVVTETWKSTSVLTEPWKSTSVVTESLKPSSVVTETWKSTSVITEPWKSTSVLTEPWKSTSVVTEPWKPTSAITTATSSVSDGVTDKRTDDEFDPVLLIVVPVTALLVVVAFIAGVVICWRHRHHSQRGKHNVETGSELSTKNLTESLENLNRSKNQDFSNPGAEDRSSRSMSRASSMSNLETIHEGNEPDEPEIYDL